MLRQLSPNAGVPIPTWSAAPSRSVKGAVRVHYPHLVPQHFVPAGAGGVGRRAGENRPLRPMRGERPSPDAQKRYIVGADAPRGELSDRRLALHAGGGVLLSAAAAVFLPGIG